MNDVLKSVAESIRKRTVSATLGTYLFFWLAYHWEGVYTTLFVDQTYIYNQHGLLKNEYVNQYFFGINGVDDTQFYLGFVVPVLLTYLFIWWMPHILLRAYRREIWFKVEKRIIKIDQEKRILEDKRELAKETTETINEETKVVRARKKAANIDPKINWDEEYSKLSQKQVDFLGNLLACIYRYKGQVLVSGQFANMPEFEINPNALRFGDSHDLIRIIEKGARIELTEKGKHFANKYEGTI